MESASTENREAPVPYRLYGHIGSPYSMKVRASLRYRQIPHVFLGQKESWMQAFAKVRVPVMPVLEYPDGTFHNDSTPLLLDLEGRHGGRSIVPNRESDAFLAFLLEDLADEWLSKAMYAYRWAYPEHTGWTGRLIAYDQDFGGGLEHLEAAGSAFERRQVGRNALVGCTPENLPTLMEIARKVLDAMETMVPQGGFLFGSRPSLADFAIFGQISQFIVDFAALEPCRKRAPYTMRWVQHMHDLSGHIGQWREDGQELPDAVSQLLALAGEAYLPFLLANEQAIADDAEEFSLRVGGRIYTQAPFKYQGKCLNELRSRFAQLSPEARRGVTPILAEHHCLGPLETTGQRTLVS